MIAVDSGSAIQLAENYLLPEHQGRGIGTHLIKTLLAEAAHQLKPVHLQVLKVNLRARQLYERLGFEPTGETHTHFLMSTRPKISH